MKINIGKNLGENIKMIENDSSLSNTEKTIMKLLNILGTQPFVNYKTVFSGNQIGIVAIADKVCSSQYSLIWSNAKEVWGSQICIIGDQGAEEVSRHQIQGIGIQNQKTKTTTVGRTQFQFFGAQGVSKANRQLQFSGLQVGTETDKQGQSIGVQVVFETGKQGQSIGVQFGYDIRNEQSQGIGFQIGKFIGGLQKQDIGIQLAKIAKDQEQFFGIQLAKTAVNQKQFFGIQGSADKSTNQDQTFGIQLEPEQVEKILKAMSRIKNYLASFLFKKQHQSKEQ